MAQDKDRVHKEAVAAALGLKYLGKGAQGADTYKVPADFWNKVENFK